MQPDIHNRTDEKSLNAKGVTTYASFDIDIPQLSDFDRQMEIQANLQPSEIVRNHTQNTLRQCNFNFQIFVLLCFD